MNCCGVRRSGGLSAEQIRDAMLSVTGELDQLRSAGRASTAICLDDRCM